ncbi:MAG: DUF1015 domain-containing protein [Acidobacteria bacterium]|nr:DUF1015 domain-containing protein [Acidobacteriota bacterium]
MAHVLPFRALRYPSQLSQEMARLTAPPYDVITEKERLRLESLHPHNVVRLILPGQAGRAQDGSFYSGAASLLSQWQESGDLARDSEPAFYPYRQTFRGPEGELSSRLGFLGALELPGKADSEKAILPHEKTLEGPRQDRTRLILACRANLSPIFLLHPDSTKTVGATLEEVTRIPPLFGFADPSGVTHELWKVDDSVTTLRLENALRADWTLIADGHHRYESALAVREALPGEAGAGYVLAFFCSLQDRGFRIFPIHRLLRGGDDSLTHGIPRALRERHRVESLMPDSGPEEILQRLRQAGERTFALVTPEDPPLLVRLAADGNPAQDPLEEFDTVLLQKEVLSRMLGLSGPDIASGAVGYTSDAAEAIRQVRSAEARAAFLLNPLKVEAVVRAAQRGLRLPQKSTYFYPKVYTGLVIRPF